MRKSTLILIAVGALITSLVWAFIYKPEEGGFAELFSFEPKYEGHTFTYWMQHWYLNPWGSPVNTEARVALKTMGAQAAPYLVEWIRKPPIYHPGLNYPERALKGFEVLGPVAKPAIPDLIKIIGQNQNYPERALLCIGKDAVPPLADKLMETLSDTNNPFIQGAIRMEVRKTSGFYIRGCVLKVLSQMGTNAEAAMPALIKTVRANLPSYSSPMFEQNPYMVLANVGQNHPDSVISTLLERFTNPALSVIERGAIANTMSVFGTNQASVFMPVLIAAFSSKKTNDWTRVQIGRALEVIGQNHTDLLVPIFLAATKDASSEENLRCCMAQYLARAGHDQPDIVLPALLMAYTNFSLSGRSDIAGALATFGHRARSAVPLLLADSRRQVDQKKYDYRCQINLAIAAKTIAPETPETLTPLFNDLESSQGFVRQQTIGAIARLGTNGLEAVPALLKCLSHPDSQTRIDAIRALLDIGESSDQFIGELGENLSHTNSFTASEAYSTLGGFAGHHKLAFVTLVKKGISGSVSRDVRQQVKWILVNTSRDNPTFMLECLDDPDAGVRSGALAVFYELARNVPQSIPKLRQLTANDPDPYVRSLAADILQLQLQQ